jgi:DNA-binding NtrC family response regulator
LASDLLQAICSRLGSKVRRLGPEAMESLMAYDWRRNNVRELRNVLERMVIASDQVVLGADSVPAELRGGVQGGDHAGGTFAEQKAEAERRIVLAALERNQWHVTRTASDLGLADHASLLKIMRRLGVERG